MLRTEESYFEKIAVKASGTQIGTKTPLADWAEKIVERRNKEKIR